jgi:hypothetical protein
VVSFWLSHQELAVERNVNVGEELLEGRVLVQEQQPEEFRHSACLTEKLRQG